MSEGRLELGGACWCHQSPIWPGSQASERSSAQPSGQTRLAASIQKGEQLCGPGSESVAVTAPFTLARSSDTTLSLASINRPGLSSPGQHQAAACHIVGLACEHPVVSSAVLCDGNVPLTMSLETRSNSALMKRAEQLKRWQDSETAREPGDLKRKKRRIGFSDGCVFLAACAACDRDEVRSLISRGTDIDTANVDGLTALHQVRIVMRSSGRPVQESKLKTSSYLTPYLKVVVWTCFFYHLLLSRFNDQCYS